MLATMECDAAAVIASLDLAPNPAGGYVRQYHSARYPGVTEGSPMNKMITVIYYLLTLASPLARLHRVHADGLHFHHAGGVLRIHSLGPADDYRAELLGPPNAYQVAVAGGRWKAIELVSGPWALISEAVVPGWSPELHESADMSLRDRVSPALWAILGPFVGDAP